MSCAKTRQSEMDSPPIEIMLTELCPDVVDSAVYAG
jgi:hypothetical protein